MSEQNTGHLVVALAYEGLCTFEFGCTAELFALQRPELGVPWYRFEVCSLERGPLAAAGGVEITAPHGIEALERADTIVVPGWRDADEHPPAELLERLHAAYERGVRICSVCSGVFVLAAAGIVGGTRVTTHWRYAEKLATRYPEIEVDARALYIDAGQILTSAGSAAGLDMFLHLVRNDHGPRIANQVAQRLVIPPHREGGQAQYVRRPMTNGRGRLSKLLDWIREHAAEQHTVATLARRASMSPRTLQRHFRDSVGVAPLEWVVRERVAIARDLLETTIVPIGRVAEHVGFGSPESFRRHFRRIVGTSPAAYRRQFSTVHEPSSSDRIPAPARDDASV